MTANVLTGGPREPEVFLDITDLFTWPGRRTGIQRVTADIVDGYLSFRDVRLVYFVNRLVGYVEVSIELYRSTLIQAIESGGRSSFVAKWLRSPGQVALMPKFRPGDAVILTGGGWTQLDGLRELARLKDRRGVTVHRFIHDVMPMTEPQFFHPDEIAQFIRYTHRALSIADSALTSSAWNAEQLTALFAGGQLPVRPLTVVGLGDDSLVNVEPARPALDLASGAFALVVGSLDVRKNQRLIYQAYQLARSRGSTPPPLVLVGPHGRMWQESVHLIGRDTRRAGQFTVASDVSDSELAWLYRNCAYTIYPSLCEGWGLPIGESLAFGKVCLSSNSSAMPEVGTSFAHYFDPNNPVELRDLIEQFAQSEPLRRAEEIIKRRFRPRRWRDVARALDSAVRAHDDSTHTADQRWPVSDR